MDSISIVFKHKQNENHLEYFDKYTTVINTKSIEWLAQFVVVVVLVFFFLYWSKSTIYYRFNIIARCEIIACNYHRCTLNAIQLINSTFNFLTDRINYLIDFSFHWACNCNVANMTSFHFMNKDVMNPNMCRYNKNVNWIQIAEQWLFCLYGYIVFVTK